MWVLGKGLRARVAGALVAVVVGFAAANEGVAAVGAGADGPPKALSPSGAAPAAGGERRVDLSQLLTSAGFADAVPMSDEELSQAGEHFSAGWSTPSGDLVGLLFLVPAEEPRATIGTFVDQLDLSCRGRFDAAPDRVEALDGRIVGRANAACHNESLSLHYDLVFHFAASGTLGIVHIASDESAPRAREINSGLIEILATW